MSDASSVGTVATSVSVQKALLDYRGVTLTKVAPMLFVILQLGALFVALRLLQIEPETGLSRILPLIFGGFVVHATLPVQWRLPFFVALSVASSIVVLGLAAGSSLVVVALLLLGVCHVPIKFSFRVLILLLISALLAAVRLGRVELTLPYLNSGASTLPRIVLPVLASMFMFRLIIYMYDLRHEERARANAVQRSKPQEKSASVWSRFSYFLLLPNVCFLLFPIIDYRTYRRTYYDRDASLIYQRGVWLIFLGTLQLLLYRAIYHFLIPSPEDVQGIAGIVRFVTSAYLIYFRVVGQFHIIIGLLCLFGFNLPPAHRFFLLASSYTDFWRRARIEWKDFMVKVFYYPALVPLQRKIGATGALVVSTIIVFVATWLLHGYQWFWFVGDFRLFGNDGPFWIIIGTCVLVNSLLELRKSRVQAPVTWSVVRATIHAAKVVGMFVFMCVLWSYWSSPSFRIWRSYMTALGASSWSAYLLLVVLLACIIALGVLAQLAASKWKERLGGSETAARTGKQFPRAEIFWSKDVLWKSAATLAGAAVLIVLSRAEVRKSLPEGADHVMQTLSANTLNAVDQEREDRGYYEELLDVPRSTGALAAAAGELKRTFGTQESAPADEQEPPTEETRAGDRSGPALDSRRPTSGSAAEKRN